MQPDIVPKSFGCIAHRSLKLSLTRSRSRSKSSSRLSSPRTPKSPGGSTSSSRGSTSSIRSKEDEYREVFRRFDNDNDGKISSLELRSYFGSIGEYMSQEDATAVIGELDSDGDNLIDFQDFYRMMNKEGGSSNGGDDHNQDLKAAFEMFEYEKGSGRITPKSLQRVLSRLGDSKSYDECAAMIRVFDTEGKGEIGYSEFQEMMIA